MSSDNLSRLRPFEGLCMTANDFVAEQNYHRQNLYRHAVQLHGYGIVQGLSVKLQQRKGGYIATIDGGYGITRRGQGVHLSFMLSLCAGHPGGSRTRFLS